MIDVGLRQAEQADSEFAYRVKRAAFGRYVAQVWGWHEAEQRRLHERRFRPDRVRVITADGHEVGILASVAAPDCVNVNQLFVLPEHQGRGIGRRAMKAVVAEADELGLPVRLRVLRVNPRAEAFYRRLGFVPTGQTGTHVLMERPHGPSTAATGGGEQ